MCKTLHMLSRTITLHLPLRTRPQGSSRQELSEDEAQIYRSVVGKLLFISKDRPDLGFAVKELCRDVKNPLGRSWRKLKRCLRYLAGSRDLGIFMKKSDRASAKRPKLEVFVDSDWAGVTDDGRT